jgi:hypothetical protein
MPRFDGTGPQGEGPMSGRGEGHCVLELAKPGQPARGYAGLKGRPVLFWGRALVPARRLFRAVGRGRDRRQRRR